MSESLNFVLRDSEGGQDLLNNLADGTASLALIC